MLGWLFDRASRESRLVSAFYPSDFAFALTPTASDQLLSYVSSGERPAEIAPLLLHEFTHAFLSRSPLCSLSGAAEHDVAFARNQFCFGQRVDFQLEWLFLQAEVGSCVRRYTSFWQEGLATFVELNTRCDGIAGCYWSDTHSAFKAALFASRAWSSGNYDECIAAQSRRLEHVLKLPCSGDVERSYLVAYLVVSGIIEHVTTKLPNITIEAAVELLRCVLFVDRSVWIKAATVVSRASQGNVVGAGDDLKAAFEHGCAGVALFLNDIEDLSEAEAAALTDCVMNRTYAPNPSDADERFPTVEFPMLERWSRRSVQVLDEDIDRVTSNIGSNVTPVYLRTPSKSICFQSQQFSYFDFFELDPDLHMVRIDFRACFCFERDSSVGVFFDPLSQIRDDAPKLEFPKRNALYLSPSSGWEDNTYTLFFLPSSGKIGVAIIGENLAMLQSCGEQFTPVETLRVYRTLLRKFHLTRAYQDGSGESALVERARVFQSSQREVASTIDLRPARGWTRALDQIIDLFPVEATGPSTLKRLMASRSFCPTIDEWFQGNADGKANDRCASFARSQVQNLYRS